MTSSLPDSVPMPVPITVRAPRTTAARSLPQAATMYSATMCAIINPPSLTLMT